MRVEPRPVEDHLQPMSDELDGDGAALADDTVNQEELAPLLRVGAVVDAAVLHRAPDSVWGKLWCDSHVRKIASGSRSALSG